MPSLFARHRRNGSTDTSNTPPSASSNGPGHARKASLTESGPPPSASATSGLLGNLKARMGASKVSLALGEEDQGTQGGFGGKRRFSIGQVFKDPSGTNSNAPSNAALNLDGLNGGRRNSIATPGSPSTSTSTARNYPPGTKIMPTPPRNSVLGSVAGTLEGDENSQRRRGVEDLLDLEQEPVIVGSPKQGEVGRNGAAAPGLSGWKPLVPDNKGMNTVSPTTSPLASPSPMRKFTNDTSTPTTPASPPPRTNRVPPGRIALPPPGLVSRKSTASHGMGLSIVPSTPLPQRIANLPTLNGGTPMASQGSGSGSMTPGYGFPGTGQGGFGGLGTAGGQGSRPGSGQAGTPSLGNSPGSVRSDARWAKKAMPVMLREPSHRPVAPVIASPEQEGSDSDSQESSESESGSDDDDDEDDSSEEGGSSAMTARPAAGRTSLGEVDQRGLLDRRERVDSISEDPEEEQVSPGEANRRRLSALSIPDRRQLVAPRLDGLPQNPVEAKASGSQMPSQSRTSSTSWALPTPKTPGANSFFSGAGAGWTQFGAATPTIGTPMGSPSAKSPSGRAALGAFNLPNGVAKAAALSRNQTPAAGVKVGETSYFDTARPVADGNATPTPISARSAGIDDDDDVEEVVTPRAEEPELLSGPSEPTVPVAAAPLPLDLSNLPGMIPVTQNEQASSPIHEAFRPEGSTSGSRPTTPLTSRPMMLKHKSRSMVDLSAAASPSRQPLAEPASRRPSADEEPVSSSSPVEPAERSEISPVDMIPIGESLRKDGDSPIPSARSSADWARPPPTPGIGMTQPFRFGTATPSGPSTPITSPKKTVIQRQMSDARGSPLRRRRSLDDTRVKPPKYEPPEPKSGIPGPREEEGRENLPDYWCHVHIEGYLPRKMEFSAPGMQARDRSWKRLYFVLHGTSLRVFKHDVHKIPFKDHTSISIPEVSEADLSNLHVHKPGERRESVSTVGATRPGAPAAPTGRRGSLVEGSVNAPTGRRGSLPGMDPDAISPAGRRTSQSSVGSSIATAGTTATTTTTSSEKDMSLFQPVSQANQARRASVSVPPPAPSAGINARENIAVHLPFGGGNALVKQYSLQNAESGLAADYVKKRNVVRVRAEGEQFLLQTDSAKDVVDWIEAFQAATNVSLELDTRPMPKIITLPRRRRRRRPGEAADRVNAAQPGVADNDDTPEGNARAVEQAERAAAAASARESNSRNVNAMEAMLAEDQAAA